MNLTEAAELLKNALRRPVAYHRAFADISGKVSAGLMLSQAWYWTPKADNNEGWFYKTRAEWREETGMSRTEQETARKRLVKLGLFEEKLAGMPGKLHFRVNTERLISLLVENPPTRRRKVRQAVGGKSTNKMAENPPTVHTESTTETSSESTQTSAFADLMRFHSEHLKGPIPDPAAQGSAIKWLLLTYTPVVAKQCYEAQLGDDWRAKVSWLSVKSEIGNWLSRNGNHQNSTGKTTNRDFEFKPKSIIR